MRLETTIHHALELARKLNEKSFHVAIYITPHTGRVTVQLRTDHFGTEQRPMVAEIHRICNVPFTKNKTNTNRTIYRAEKHGFKISCPTNIPICDGSTLCKKPKQQFETFWVCPIKETEAG